MPSFTAAVSDLHVSGPVVDVGLAVSRAAEDALLSVGESVPPPIYVSMMIDTGASQSVIQQGLAVQLGLSPVAAVAINTPSSTNVICDVYAVRLLLPENIVAGVTAIEAPLQGQHIQGLIGRDLLKHGVLVYLGTTDQFTLSF